MEKVTQSIVAISDPFSPALSLFPSSLVPVQHPLLAIISNCVRERKKERASESQRERERERERGCMCRKVGREPLERETERERKKEKR